MTWIGEHAEDRELPSPFPADDTVPEPSANFPQMSSLRVTVTFPALAADADVWVLLSTTPCGTTFQCTPARQKRVSANAGATSASLDVEQLHASDYFLNVILDRDRNLFSTLGPSSGDGVGALDRTADVDGTDSVTTSIVFNLP